MALDEWHRSRELPLRRSLDLACGSGEATLALEAWLQKTALEAEVEAADPYTFEVGATWTKCQTPVSNCRTPVSPLSSSLVFQKAVVRQVSATNFLAGLRASFGPKLPSLEL